MYTVSEAEFEKILANAIDDIPPKYASHIKNLAFVVEDIPSLQQRQKLNLQHHQTLFGLYEGVPLTQRGSNYNLVLPDKITIFKLPIEANVNSLAELIEQVRHTLWHEVAHYYGLNHDHINKLDKK